MDEAVPSGRSAVRWNDGNGENDGMTEAGWPRAPWRTRFAPAPTGRLHLGHAVNALFVWGLAGALGGRVLLRIEDHDRVRSRAVHEQALLDDLDWLGLAPDPDPASGAALVRQSERGALYERALAGLAGRDLVYPCDCTRRAVLARTGATAGVEGVELRYPGTCRDRAVEAGRTTTRRVRLEREAVAFRDLRLGDQLQVPAEQCGDLLARDRDGNWTYQFAVVVDDLAQGIDLVVRGEDLLASTGRQIQLGRLLGRARPAAFLHHPLIRHPDGRKLSKSAGDTGLAELRAAGWSPGRVLAEAARRAGLAPGGGELTARDLAGFVGDRILNRRAP